MSFAKLSYHSLSSIRLISPDMSIEIVEKRDVLHFHSAVGSGISDRKGCCLKALLDRDFRAKPGHL